MLGEQVTKHDDVFMLDGEGMPTVGNPFVKGRLFVIFKVSSRACCLLRPQSVACVVVVFFFYEFFLAPTLV